VKGLVRIEEWLKLWDGLTGSSESFLMGDNAKGV